MSYETRIKRGIRPWVAKNIVVTKLACAVSLLLLPFVALVMGFIEIWLGVYKEGKMYWDELVKGE